MSSISGNTNSAIGHAKAKTTKFQRDLHQAVATGRFDCSKEVHFIVRRFPDPNGGERTFSDVDRRPLTQIFSMMMPGHTAKCECERLACEAHWNYNFHGMYTSVAISPGSYTKGIDNSNPTPRRVCSVNFILKPDEFKFLTVRFPQWHFTSRHPNGHDHPIAHATASVAAHQLMEQLPRGHAACPKVYVDLHGNPGANESYMRRNPGVKIITVVELVTPRDYVRQTVKWGPRLNGDGTSRWTSMSIRDLPSHPDSPIYKTRVDGFLAHHTLYYYDRSEVCALLTAFKCPLYASMHRFEERSGTMNNGEQVYVIRSSGSQDIVYQTNVLANSQYSHPDNAPWFNHDSYTNGEHGIGWDINMLCDGTFKFTIVYCPAVQCRMSARCADHAGVLRNEALPIVEGGESAVSQAYIAETNVVSMKLCGVTSTMPIDAHLVKFFGDMRTAVAASPRTAAQYKDHVSRCRRAISSVMAERKITVDPQVFANLARFSFYIDFDDQFQNDKSMMGISFARTINADSLYREGGAHVTRATMAALIEMCLQASTAKNTVQAVAMATRTGLQHLQKKSLLTN